MSLLLTIGGQLYPKKCDLLHRNFHNLVIAV